MRSVLAWVALLLGFGLLFQGHAWPACAAIIVWLVLINGHATHRGAP